MKKKYILLGYKVKRWSDLRWSETIHVEKRVCEGKKEIEEVKILNELKKHDPDILDVKLIVDTLFS